MPTVKSCFKLWTQTVVLLMLKISRINIWYLDQNNLHAFVRHWVSPSDIFSHLPQNLMIRCLDFFPLSDSYLITSESGCAVAGALFQCLAFSCVPVGVCRGDKMGICHHQEIGTIIRFWGKWLKPKIPRTHEGSSLIDLILAMTVLLSDMTLTLRKSRVHCSGIM